LKHRYLATFRLQPSVGLFHPGLTGVLRYIKPATDLPDGLTFRICVKYPIQKYFAFSEDKIRCVTSPVPPPQGAYRDRHGRGKRDAMDVKARQTSAAGTDGQIVWAINPAPVPVIPK
jgi:hypothetical protein